MPSQPQQSKFAGAVFISQKPTQTDLRRFLCLIIRKLLNISSFIAMT